MKKNKIYNLICCGLVFIFVFMILIMPFFTFAQEAEPKGLVPACDSKTVEGQCTWGFNELMTLINNIIRFILFRLAVPIAAIMFCYAGFLLTFSSVADKKTKAKEIFTDAVIGLAIAVAAFLIIRTILAIVGYEGAWIFEWF